MRGRLYVRDLKRWWKRYDRTYGWKWRTANGVVALVVLLGAVGPGLGELISASRYMLTADALQLVGKVDPGLTSLLSYDSQKVTYEFNKSAIKSDDTSPLSTMKSQVGTANGSDEDKSTYALSVPANFSKGVTYTDINSSLSFTMTPRFGAMDGKLQQDRLIFPMSEGAQAVYTLKNNGLKEDILVDNPSNDTMTFSYDFKLPKTLAVKYIPDGEGAIGIYAANPSLYGNITYGNDSDRQAVEKARETAAKDYLVFGLPAPVIKDTKGRRVASAHFELKGTTLKVVAEGLRSTKGPVTIDPSVIVTSSSDFQTAGNDEGNIDFATSGQLSRASLTGGSVGTWTGGSTFTTARSSQGTVAYNGYMYVIGGDSGSNTAISSVQYVPINSNASLGTWAATTALPAVRTNFSAVAYNGYIYVAGGTDGTNPYADVLYAAINSDGTLGSWKTGTSFTTARSGAGTVAYNGYLYVYGGYNGGGLADVQYAPLNGDGSLGSWTSTTSFSTGRRIFMGVQNNGYLYVVGGDTGTGASGATQRNDVQYAKINSDGTVGTWTTTTSFTNVRSAHGAIAYRGYLYIMGGYNSSFVNQSDVQYAPINANGSVGSWSTTTSMANPRFSMGVVSYNSTIYYVGGSSSSATRYNEVYYSTPDKAGRPKAFATLTGNFTTARALTCSVAYNGYLYVLGGSTADSNNNNVTGVQYTALNASTGNNTSWSTTTVLPVALGSAACVASSGFLYITGGFQGTGTGSVNGQMYYIAINSNGTLGASWTTSATSPPATERPALFTYGVAGQVYMYMVGSGASNNVSYAAIDQSTGVLGTWTDSGVSMVNTYGHRGYAQVGKYLYAFGGANASTVYATVEYTSINSNGSINAWAATTSMNTAIGFTNGTTVNGCIYSVGGENGAGTSMNNVQYACPAANGTISAWYAAPNLTVATTDLGVTSYNGYIYGVGGYTTGSVATTQYAFVNNGNSGNLGTWSSTTSLATARQAPASVAYNGYLYVLGGVSSSSYLNDVQYAPLNANGTIGAWASTTSFTTGRDLFGAVAWKGYLYVFGGTDGTNYYNDVQYAPINSNGTVGTWSSTTSFTTSRDAFGFAAYNGYLYVMGGYSNSGSLNDVQYAPINSNGTVGTWSSTTSFTTVRNSLSAVAYNGYLYVLGGMGSSYLGDVQYTPINSNGTVGTWVATSGFNMPRYGHNVIASNGFLYILGGYNGSFLNDVQYAPINSNGTVGTWSSTTSFTTVRDASSAVVSNGYLYIIAGVNGSYLNDVQYAPVNVIARTARYSKLVDLGLSTNVTSLTYNGSTRNAVLPGMSPISLRLAANDGVFGGDTNAASIQPVARVCYQGQDYTRYAFVTIIVDDSVGQALGGGFADSAGTPANVTDFTVNYTPVHPLPDVRLRHGQTLQQGNQTALDTCTIR